MYCENITLDGLKIHGEGLQSENCYYGIIGTHVYGLKVINCEIYHIRVDAIDLDHLYNAEFGNNHIYNVNMSNASGDGMQLSGDLVNLHIHNNIIDRSGTVQKFGIILHPGYSTNITIEYNHFIGPDEGAGGAGLFYSAHDEKGTGIIRGNIFENGPSGLYIHTNANVGHNVFIRNGVGLYNVSGDVNIGNNVFYANETAINSVDQGFLKNNIIYLTSPEQVGLASNMTDVSNNIQNLSQETEISGFTYTDPLFVNPETHDFRLQEGSPAIDAGVDINFDYDFQGNVNHCNGIPDIGAFEFQQNCPEIQNHRPEIVPPPDALLLPGDKYMLDLTNSYDLDDEISGYYWFIPPGLDIVSYMADSSILALYAPEVQEDKIFIIKAFVSDSRLFSDTATIRITVKAGNTSPVAEAGQNQVVFSGDTVQLDGSNSYDADNDTLRYMWMADYPEISLVNSTTDSAYFIAPAVTEQTPYIVELLVFDGIVFSPADQVVVTVNPNTQTAVEITQEVGSRIYPTFTSTWLTIEGTNVSNLPEGYQIYSVQGQLLISGQIDEKIHSVNVSELKKGTYFIRLRHKNGEGYKTFTFIRK